MEDATRSEEYRAGRCFIRRGDLVRVAPVDGSAPGTHGYMARFLYVAEDTGGLFACVVEHEKNEKGLLTPCGFRFIKPERMERKAITGDPLKRARLKKEAK